MAPGVLLKSGGMATIHCTLFVMFYVFPLVQILWDDSFTSTVESGKTSYLLNTYGRALLLKPSTFLFTGTAFFVCRSCGWNRAGGKFLSVKSGCRALWKQYRQFMNSTVASAGPSYSVA